MADFIPVEGSIRRDVPTPLTLTSLLRLVGRDIKIVELSSGDILIVNTTSTQINHNAASFVGKTQPVYGDAILCSPSELE